MEILTPVFYLIILLYLSLNSLAWLYWIQDKEYRADRFIAFMKTPEAKIELFVFPKMAIWFLILSLIPFGFADFGVWLYIIIFDSVFAFFILNHKMRRPVFTQRGIRILLTSFLFFLLALTLFADDNPALLLIVLEVVSIVGLVIGTAWTSLISQKVMECEKEEAVAKLTEFQPTVIGITGSYGKTTTKEFLASVLSGSFKVAKNAGSQNTQFGIIRAINKNVDKKTSFVVLEIGAYKKGEIRTICDFTHPTVAIMTGIEPQHLELFGTMQNLIEAKSELIDALPDGAIAAFNLNNEYCENLYEKYKQQGRLEVYGYKVSENDINDEHILTTKISKKDDATLYFTSKFRKNIFSGSVKISSPSFIQNLSAAILVAKLLGVSDTKILNSLEKISLPEKTLKVVKLKTGSIVIDDSFNSVPAGFSSALEYLKDFGSKRIVFMTGIIELGNESGKIHRHLGKLLKASADVIYLRNPSFSASLRSGLGKEEAKLTVVTNINRLAEEFEKYAGVSGNTILLEGKLPIKLLESFDKLKV